METTDRDAPRHPMGVVSQRTGLTSHAIRAWERRYGIVSPTRTDGGHRLYSDRQVERLRLLHRLTLGGRQIGQLVELTDDELASQLLEDERAGAEAPGKPAEDGDDAYERLVDQALEAVRDLDSETLERILRRAVISLEAPVYLDRLMGPLLAGIGDAWAENEVTPAHEHLASAVVQGVGRWLLDQLDAPVSAPTLVVATPAGNRHELGALAAAIVAASAGWRIQYLGADLPAIHIAKAVQDSSARALALSMLYPGGEASISDELRTLREAVGPGMPILVGGSAADTYSETLEEIGALLVSGLGEFRNALAREIA